MDTKIKQDMVSEINRQISILKSQIELLEIAKKEVIKMQE